MNYKCRNCGAKQDAKHINAMIDSGFGLRHLACSECGQQSVINESASELGRMGGKSRNPRKGFGSNHDAQRRAQEARRSAAYRIEGVITTRWYPTRSEAWTAYLESSERKGYDDAGHIPGDVAGDAHESDGTAIYGVRDGHATVTLRIRKAKKEEVQ